MSYYGRAYYGSSYYDRQLPRIIDKLRDRFASFEQWEYDTMIEHCRGSSSEAWEIRDALKDASYYGYPQFRYVSRVSADEYNYAFGW